MTAWLDQARQELDRVSQPVPFFFRDDDAGWADRRLLALLDLFAHHSVPLDIAAIPAELGQSVALELSTRLETDADGLAIHQHGYAHRNHEPEGLRKCEFGASRNSALQQSDLSAGKQRLFDLFGPKVKPIFTPPWNRCSAVTFHCLIETGFTVLSRDITARRRNIDSLFELPITIDWFANRKGIRLGATELGAELAAGIGAGEPVGMMLHHALMDQEELQACGELLKLLAAHDNADCYLMDQLAGKLANVDPAARYEVASGVKK
jgi:hypothetical protein